jgi:hypothetical protein
MRFLTGATRFFLVFFLVFVVFQPRCTDDDNRPWPTLILANSSRSAVSYLFFTVSVSSHLSGQGACALVLIRFSFSNSLPKKKRKKQKRFTYKLKNVIHLLLTVIEPFQASQVGKEERCRFFLILLSSRFRTPCVPPSSDDG